MFLISSPGLSCLPYTQFPFLFTINLSLPFITQNFLAAGCILYVYELSACLRFVLTAAYFIPAAVLFRSVIIRVLELISAKMAVEKFLLVVTVEPPRLEQDVEGAGGSAHCRTRTVSAARCSAHHAPSCGALCATKKVGVFIWSLQLFSLFNTRYSVYGTIMYCTKYTIFTFKNFLFCEIKNCSITT